MHISLLIQTRLFFTEESNIRIEWCGLLVGYCDVFISCLDSQASDGMLNFPKSVLMKKQTHLHLGWPEGEYSNFSFLGELLL